MTRDTHNFVSIFLSLVPSSQGRCRQKFLSQISNINEILYHKIVLSSHCMWHCVWRDLKNHLRNNFRSIWIIKEWNHRHQNQNPEKHQHFSQSIFIYCDSFKTAYDRLRILIFFSCWLCRLSYSFVLFFLIFIIIINIKVFILLHPHFKLETERRLLRHYWKFCCLHSQSGCFMMRKINS